MKKNRLCAISIILLLVVISLSCIPKQITIQGSSMSPTIKHGETVYFKVITEDIKRSDIVYMKNPKESFYMIARIVGLPKEEIRIKDNKVYVNGQILTEEYVSPENNKRRLKEGDFKVEENKYLVLGDNRDNSLDSRYFGLVERDKILAVYNYTVKKSE